MEGGWYERWCFFICGCVCMCVYMRLGGRRGEGKGCFM